MTQHAIDVIIYSLATGLLVSYTVLLHVTRLGEDPAWLIWLRYLLLIVLLVLAALFLCLSWKAPWLALNANNWRALSHGMIGLSFISTQVLSIGYAIGKFHTTHATFSYIATAIAFSVLLGYLVPASLRADTDEPPEWIWGALGAVSCAAAFLFGHAFPKTIKRKAHLLAATVLNVICFGASVSLTILSALERLDQPFAFQCIPPMITITSQIVLGWRGTWKLFRMVGTCVFTKRASGEQADANPQASQNIEGQVPDSRTRAGPLPMGPRLESAHTKWFDQGSPRTGWREK